MLEIQRSMEVLALQRVLLDIGVLEVDQPALRNPKEAFYDDGSEAANSS
jgi:hypothetical protein